MKDITIENIYSFYKNMKTSEKMKLISSISSSIVKDKKNKEKLFLNCFGKFVSSKSAEELVNEIHSARNFTT